MDDLFGDYIAEGWLVIYMDDLLIHSLNQELHDEHTQKVLQWFQEQEMYLELEKCTFSAKEVKYLSMIVGNGGIQVDPVKLKAIWEWSPLVNIKAVWSFLRFCNFYQKFIPSFSNIAHPLLDLIKQSNPWTWGPDQETAFHNLQTMFTRQLVLAFPNTSKPFTLMMDVSLTASEAIVMQLNANEDMQPCGYLSQIFSLAKWNDNIFDQELLAMIRGLEEWRQYLLGSLFTMEVLTDHKNLTYFKKLQKLSQRQAQWLLFLQDFDMIYWALPGMQMAPANPLSCWDDMNTTQDNMDIQLLPSNTFNQQLWAIDVALADKIKDSSSSDPLVLQAVHQMEKELPLFNRSRVEDWTFDNSWLYYKTHLYVPELACHDLVAATHSSFEGGHGGHLHTITLLSQDYWWPSLSTYVCKYVSGCTVCQAHKVLIHLMVPAITPLAFKCYHPFQNLSVDLITNLPPVRGLNSVMVVVDHGLSKGVILAPYTKTMDAAGIAQLFFNHVFKQFGLHEKVMSDHRLQFASAFARELARLLQYDIALSLAYHPQTNGETECYNQELETYLCIFCKGQPQKWLELLPMAKFAHNTAIHSVTGKSPFFLIMEYQPWSYPPLGMTFLPALEQQLNQIEDAWKETEATHKLAQQCMKEWTLSCFKPWKIRDKVWLKTRNLKLQIPFRKLLAK